MAANKANLTKADLERALRALEPEDRIGMEKMIVKAEENMKIRGYEVGFPVMFGSYSAMELIAKVGMFFIKKGVKSID